MSGRAVQSVWHPDSGLLLSAFQMSILLYNGSHAYQRLSPVWWKEHLSVSREVRGETVFCYSLWKFGQIPAPSKTTFLKQNFSTLNLTL